MVILTQPQKDKKLLKEAHGENIARIEAALKAGADINAEEKRGYTPLAVAAMSGRSKVCEFLIQNGAMVDHEDFLKRTPLMLAAAGGHLETCGILIKAGANVNAKDSLGGNALTQSASHQVSQLLIDNGAQGKSPQLKKQMPAKAIIQNGPKDAKRKNVPENLPSR